jgi:predicted enzyme related to lactoylglutathione lyase
MVWQPRRHFGAALVNVPGALCWNELASPDLDASAAFYRDLFGWTIEPYEGTERPYLVIRNGDRGNGGIRPAQQGEPPNWSAYFATEDVDASLAKVEELGGKQLMPPIEIEIARIAAAQDPQGAVFVLYAGQLEE